MIETRRQNEAVNYSLNSVATPQSIFQGIKNLRDKFRVDLNCIQVLSLSVVSLMNRILYFIFYLNICPFQKIEGLEPHQEWVLIHSIVIFAVCRFSKLKIELPTNGIAYKDCIISYDDISFKFSIS